jgi:hypothetical protein
MRLDGALADEQVAGDLGVGPASDERDQHLAFSFGEPAELGRGPRAAAGKTLDQPASERGRDQGVAVGRGPDPEQQFLGASMFQQEPGGPGVQRVEDILVEVEGGEHHDLGRARPECHDPPGGLDAVQAGHPDIHEHDIRARPGYLADRGHPVRGFAGHFQVRLSLDEHADPRSH